MFNIIVACCKNRGIGINNQIPWRIKEDLTYFKNLTKGNGSNSVIMGRKTWESLPEKRRPLDKRSNIVVSRTMKNNEGCYVLKDPELVPIFCKNRNYSENWIIGGSEIYDLFIKMGVVNKIFISEIDKEYDCDVFLSDIEKGYLLESEDKREILLEDSYNEINYKVYKKIGE